MRGDAPDDRRIDAHRIFVPLWGKQQRMKDENWLLGSMLE
jgi:hypothetical protein